MQQRQHLNSLAPRAAFSLIEVLMVIGIMSLLVTILVMAIGPAITSAREKATLATLTQIDEIIQQRLAVINNADLTKEAKRFAAVTSSPGLNQAQAEFFLRKNLYRQAVPSRIEDLWGLDQDQSTAPDNSPIYISWSGQTPAAPSTSPAATDQTHSAEVLYYALTRGSRIRVTADGQEFNLPVLDESTLNPRAIQDTDSDGYLEFVDAWGQPLQCYNFPTRLIRPGGYTGSAPYVANISTTDRQTAGLLISGLPAVTSTLVYSGTGLQNPLNRDPHDPRGVVSTAVYGSTFSFTVNSGGSYTLAAVPFTEANYHTPFTYFVPLVVSLGADGTLGLELPTASGATRLAQPLSVDALADNITNRQQ